MLGLLHETDPVWVEAVEGDLDALLSDHAHCELKAAHSALSVVGRFGGEVPEMVAPLVALAHEETEHFRQVAEHMAQREARLGTPPVDAYVNALKQAARVDHRDHPMLLDRLLICALIEARSCERFKLLSDRLSSATLRAFYAELMASEARHYRLFRDLAGDRFGEEATQRRLSELATREGRIAAELPLGATVHG